MIFDTKNNLESVTNRDTNIFTFVPFFTHMTSVAMVSFFVVCLALVFPWKGGSVSDIMPLFFSLALLTSLYSLYHGYAGVKKRGLKRWSLLMWCFGIVDTVLLTVVTAVFGIELIYSTEIIFPGSSILLSPTFFSGLIVVQALYFLFESIVVSVVSLQEKYNVEDWYAAIYFLVLSLNSAAMFVGLLLLGYSRVL